MLALANFYFQKATMLHFVSVLKTFFTVFHFSEKKFGMRCGILLAPRCHILIEYKRFLEVMLFPREKWAKQKRERNT